MNNHGHQRPQPVVFMEAADVAALLTSMEQDNLLQTKPALVHDDLGSITVVTFKEKHLAYLQDHPKVNPQIYLANLRTMIKIRQ